MRQFWVIFSHPRSERPHWARFTSEARNLNHAPNDDRVSEYKAGRAGRPGLRATAPWAVPLWSGPLNSKRLRKAFLIFKIGDECPRKSARKRQKAPFYPSSKTCRGACVRCRCQRLGKTALPSSVPLNSGIFRKAFLIFTISDERPRKPCQLVPFSATCSRQCNCPLSAGIRAETLELFAHTVADSPVRIERRREWVLAPASDCRVVNTEDSPDRSCGIPAPREVNYRTGVKQLGVETSGDSIGKEGFL